MGAPLSPRARRIMVEVHHDPEHAWSDGARACTLSSSPAHADIHVIAPVIGKQLDSATWSGAVIGTDVRRQRRQRRLMGRVGSFSTRPASSTSGTRSSAAAATFRSIFEAIKAAGRLGVIPLENSSPAAS